MCFNALQSVYNEYFWCTTYTIIYHCMLLRFFTKPPKHFYYIKEENHYDNFINKKMFSMIKILHKIRF